MILLYKDPHGKTLSVVHSQTGSLRAATGASPQTGKSVTDLEKKVAILEKSVHDGEATIAKLKHQIDVLSLENTLSEVKSCHSYCMNVGVLSTVDVVAQFILSLI